MTAGKHFTKPTVVLVHGAFAESASWNGVIPSLVAAGHRVIAAANPLRCVSTDAASVASVIDGVGGPVLVVAHSYGGTVMSAAAAGKEQVIGLVYVAGFAPARVLQLHRPRRPDLHRAPERTRSAPDHPLSGDAIGPDWSPDG